MPKFKMKDTLDYEKRIALYNSYGFKNWDAQKKEDWLQECIKIYPHKPFGWIKLIENSILSNDFNKFKIIEKKFSNTNRTEYRVNVYLSLGYLNFNSLNSALKIIKSILYEVEHDPIPRRIAARILVKMGKIDEAVEIFSKFNSSVKAENIIEILNDEPKETFPIYYNY